jgi:hypothetical protein
MYLQFVLKNTDFWWVLTVIQGTRKLEWKKRPTERYRKKPYGKKREWQLKKKKQKKKL